MLLHGLLFFFGEVCENIIDS